MQRIVPTIWFDHNADEAAEFYSRAFPDTRVDARVTHPAGEQAGETRSVDVLIDGYRLTLLNGGPGQGPTPAISFFVNFDDRASLDHLWGWLTEGGIVLIPLGSYDFSAHYGWVVDRFGVNWQLMLTDQTEERPFIVPNLMFEGQAREAVDGYVALFPDARVGTRATYPGSDKIMFSEFQLCGEWLTAMDAAVEQPYTFTPGVSLLVNARGQEEIDRLWEGLSAVDAAERGGWLQDRHGVSWQIVPDTLAELLQRPGAHEKLAGMRKPVIAEF